MKRCPITRKRSFLCSIDAIVAFSDMPKMVRPYCCQHCNQWHVASAKRSWKRTVAA